MTHPAKTWLVTRVPRPQARVRLICFPYAGGAASAFHAWPALIGPHVEVSAVQLPGREARWNEPPMDDLGEAVDVLAGVISPRVDRPLALFGHSLGGLVAFELARELRRRGAAGPIRLFASACRPPDVAALHPPLHELPDQRFVAELRRLRGSSDAALDEALAEPEVLELMLPALRADFRMAETHRHITEPPLEMPVVGYAGREDESVPEHLMEGWRRQTRAAFRLEVLPGGHLFLNSAGPDLVARIGAELAGIRLGAEAWPR